MTITIILMLCNCYIMSYYCYIISFICTLERSHKMTYKLLHKIAIPGSYINQYNIFTLDNPTALSYAYAAYVVSCMMTLI